MRTFFLHIHRLIIDSSYEKNKTRVDNYLFDTILKDITNCIPLVDNITIEE